MVGATLAVAVFDLPARRRVGARPAASGFADLHASVDPRGGFRADRDRAVSPSHWFRLPIRAFCRAPTRRGLRTPVDPNQEMVGLGAANLAAGLFQGFPISSSSSRTPVAEAAGARTQLTGVVGALSIALLLVVAPESPAVSAEHRARSRRDCLRDRPDRSVRPAPHLPDTALGVLAVDGLLRGRGDSRRHPWHRAGHRDRGDRIPVGRLATAFRGAGARRSASRVITTSPAIPTRG